MSTELNSHKFSLTERDLRNLKSLTFGAHADESAPITRPVLLSKSMARLNKYLSLVTDFNDAALKQPKGDFYHWK